MLPELGHYALILATFIALAQLHPLLSCRAAVLQSALCLGSALALLAGFALSDFTLVIVAEHSHTMLPFWRRLAGPALAPEGRLIVAALAASGVSLALALRSPNMVLIRLSGLTAAILMVAALFLHPFERIYPPPFDGIAYDPLTIEGSP